MTFSKLHSKSKTQQRLNPRSSKLLFGPQTIAVFFLLAIKEQLKGYSRAAWTRSATSPLVRSTTERESAPFVRWEESREEQQGAPDKMEGKQRGFIFCL